jgi:hypothetical protein
MKERIMMTEMEYSVLKEEMEDDECGWSEEERTPFFVCGSHGSMLTLCVANTCSVRRLRSKRCASALRLCLLPLSSIDRIDH